MRKLLILVLLLCLSMNLSTCTGPSTAQLFSFYNKIEESRLLLDSIAEDIYSNWYDAVYNSKFSQDINLAIYTAHLDHEADLNKIKALEPEIINLFKTIKDDRKNGNLIKEVMSAYNDYYEFVVHVSGSFYSFSANLDVLKKELANQLKTLSYEL